MVGVRGLAREVVLSDERRRLLRRLGSLGALATQPFAGPLGVIATGDYQAAATRAPDGSITVSLDVTDVTTTNSTGQIKAAEVRGKYVPEGAGLSAEGQVRLREIVKMPQNKGEATALGAFA